MFLSDYLFLKTLLSTCRCRVMNNFKIIAMIIVKRDVCSQTIIPTMNQWRSGASSKDQYPSQILPIYWYWKHDHLPYEQRGFVCTIICCPLSLLILRSLVGAMAVLILLWNRPLLAFRSLLVLLLVSMPFFEEWFGGTCVAKSRIVRMMREEASDSQGGKMSNKLKAISVWILVGWVCAKWLLSKVGIRNCAVNKNVKQVLHQNQYLQLVYLNHHKYLPIAWRKDPIVSFSTPSHQEVLRPHI